MRFRTIALAGVAGAAAAYLFDPADGPARRARLREQVKSFADQRTNGRHSPRPVDTIEPRVSEVRDVPDRPAPEPVAEMAEPVAETAEPEPVAETAAMEPVAETPEPLAVAAEPVAETAEPEPVAETAEPEPVAETAEPEPTPDGSREETADADPAEASEETETKEPIRLPESSTVARQAGGSLGDAWNG
jgi:outer membrane biosynthesis protein TonB